LYWSSAVEIAKSTDAADIETLHQRASIVVCPSCNQANVQMPAAASHSASAFDGWQTIFQKQRSKASLLERYKRALRKN
jgi:hypothetical protein